MVLSRLAWYTLLALKLCACYWNMFLCISWNYMARCISEALSHDSGQVLPLGIHFPLELLTLRKKAVQEKQGNWILTKHLFCKKFLNEKQHDHPTCLGQLTAAHSFSVNEALDLAMVHRLGIMITKQENSYFPCVSQTLRLQYTLPCWKHSETQLICQTWGYVFREVKKAAIANKILLWLWKQFLANKAISPRSQPSTNQIKEHRMGT